ncbi:MAG: GGDEF domain-containing protein [Elusimicrobiales bacterium]|jgi:diguanylate cyclase (GGDEF)-like protein|nr:GGDEF domain-containing protein [Elusimicrobiales bacterium]NLH39145.1 GGDEF domain-containing protein [Elusimicrobiota bacterium]
MSNLNEINFIKALLDDIVDKTSVKNITVFEHINDLNILKAIFRYRFGIVSEHTEYVSLKNQKELYSSIVSEVVINIKKGKCVFSYIPYIYKSVIENNAEKQFIFRIERFDGKKYSMRDITRVKKIIDLRMSDYYKLDFENLKDTYSRNLNISASLGKIFAKSIREKEGFKFMMRGLENFFSFDRIRLYKIDESRNSLCGVYSIDRTNRINDISHDVIIMKSGVSTLVDIMLGEDDIVVKNYMVYVPLKIDYRKVGIVVVDNLLSRIKIKTHYIDLLKSFSSLVALAMENIILFEKIQEMSMYDELTKLPLRRYFNQRFQEEFYRASRFNQNLSIIWIDVDYFKEINDSFGHQVGDVVLREISQTIMKTLRKIDFPCRYGGDEIIILLPQSSNDDAYGLAKRLSEEIKKIKIDLSGFDFTKDKNVELTTSMGIASYPTDAKNMDDLLLKADEALYSVKSAGRNGIKRYSELAKEKGNINQGKI